MKDETKIKDAREEATLPPGYHLQLTFLDGPDRGLVKKLWKASTVLGRADCDVVLEDEAASKHHAEIAFEDHELILRDLDSTNGTFLNGGRVWEGILGNLDEIRIGNTVIQVSILMEESPGAAEESSDAALESDLDADTTRSSPGQYEDPLRGPLPPHVKAALQVVQGPDAGLRFEIKNKVTIIGRSGADLLLRDLDVSRKHTSIEFVAQDKVILKDLDSKNGTRINQRRISVASIKNGDQIQAGGTTINFFVTFAARPGKKS